ncbi:tRNA epoxyqueuosine(34) reductase QueG [Candidatus Peregrinibacteria bacterium]|nr:tRNA epoxyqueuosine(34) reductase QueG [Candidatus Peregrinibacteria bacterium]
MKKKITEEAHRLGFNLVGFTSPGLDNKHIQAYETWLRSGFSARMTYMEKIEKRKELSKVLPNIKTVICLATNYYHPQDPLSKAGARVARYAYGRDYHKIISRRLKKLKEHINDLKKGVSSLEYIDTGPILERAYAQKCGLGFIGKNSCLITKKYGSWIFLSEILTTLELEPDKESNIKEGDVCGSCSLCVNTCPMKAIVAPGVIDASRCISYLSIENRGEKIPDELQQKLKEQKKFFGCDICQEVCPHNAGKTSPCDQEFLAKKIAGDEIDPKEILKIKNDEQFVKKFAGSPLMRAKRKNLQLISSILSD